MIAILIVAAAAACGGHQNVGPVAGAHQAFGRHYDVTVVEAHAALIKVLTAKYGGVISDDGRHIVASAACRDVDGDACARFTHVNRDIGVDPTQKQDPAPPDHVDAGPTTNPTKYWSGTSTTDAHYWFQAFAGVVGTDGDIQIQLGGEAKDLKNNKFPIGAPGSPAWMPHEVDEVRVAVDKQLAR